MKVDEYTAVLKHDVRRLETAVQSYARLFIDMNGATNVCVSAREKDAWR